jgi:hypothetical protein
MLTLTEVKEKTEQIFEGEIGLKELKIPEPTVLWKDKLEALEEAHLESQRRALVFKMRCWQAQQLGFQEIHSSTLVEMLMGSKHTSLTYGKDRQVYEWVYDHHEDEVAINTQWGGQPAIFNRHERRSWFLPPFSKKLSWQCQFGKLDYLKREIPYGVVLRLNELKDLKLFNCFNVLAPMEAWEKKTDIDPILVATIWEMPQKKENEGQQAGEVAHFFVAQW